MHIVGYLVLGFGVVGILLGLVGLLLPQFRSKGFSFSLPRLRLPSRGAREDVDQLIAELEQSGFRNSPFESKIPAPTIVKPSMAAPRPAPAARIAAPLRLDDEEDEDDQLTLGYNDEEEEELDPVVAELLAEVQAAHAAAALEADEEADPEDEAVEDLELVVEEETLAAASAESGSDDLSDLFAETVFESKTSEALRSAVPEVDIHELLSQAQEIRTLIRTPRSRTRVG